MINLSNVASMARAVLNDSNKPKSDLMINVVSHIAGKVALQVGQSLLEQKSRLNERQQKGLSVILDALRGKEPVSHVETHASGGRFKLARAAFDVASVVWERDTKRPEVMSFISFLDSTGKSLFSLGKQLAKALTTAGPGLHQDSTVAANLRNTILTSKLHMSKVGDDRPAKPSVKPLYAELGLTDMTVDPGAIKKAYRTAALAHHPDKNIHDEGATARFQLISKAFEILSDPEKRKAYDNGLINEKGQNI